MEEYYTYILYSGSFHQTYVGQTNNIEKRLERHNAGMVSSTKRYKPWILLHAEKFENRSEAMKREKYLKSGSGREFIKQLLLEYSRKC